MVMIIYEITKNGNIYLDVERRIRKGERIEKGRNEAEWGLILIYID